MIRGRGKWTRKCMREKKDFRKKRCWIKKGRIGEQNKVAKKKKEQASSRGGPGGLRASLCDDWRVTGVPMMTVPPENAGYAGGVALMEPEKEGVAALEERYCATGQGSLTQSQDGGLEGLEGGTQCRERRPC